MPTVFLDVNNSTLYLKGRFQAKPLCGSVFFPGGPSDILYQMGLFKRDLPTIKLIYTHTHILPLCQYFNIYFRLSQFIQVYKFRNQVIFGNYSDNFSCRNGVPTVLVKMTVVAAMVTAIVEAMTAAMAMATADGE
jgi:hypothetical protein